MHSSIVCIRKSITVSLKDDIKTKGSFYLLSKDANTYIALNSKSHDKQFLLQCGVRLHEFVCVTNLLPGGI